MRRNVVLALVAIMWVGFLSIGKPAHSEDFDTSFNGTFIMNLSGIYADGDPCPADRRQQLESRIESAVSTFIEQIPLNFVEPKHVKQIVDCLTDLMNIGLTVSAIFGLNWSALLSSILSDLINQACEAATRAVDQVISEIQANIQLPNVTANILGSEVVLFGGSLSGGLTRGAPTGSIDIQINTPASQTDIKSPGFAIP